MCGAFSLYADGKDFVRLPVELVFSLRCVRPPVARCGEPEPVSVRRPTSVRRSACPYTERVAWPPCGSLLRISHVARRGHAQRPFHSAPTSTRRKTRRTRQGRGDHALLGLPWTSLTSDVTLVVRAQLSNAAQASDRIKTGNSYPHFQPNV